MTQSVHLLVDAGNSRIKWNCLSLNEQQFHHPTHSVEWNNAGLSDLLDKHWESIEEFIASVSVSNVGGAQVEQVISAWCLDHWNVEPRFAATQRQFGEIINSYDNYQELGVDRWLAVIAAHRLYPDTSNIIIDCGSATTVDTLLPTGEHRAGPILPGQQALPESLLSRVNLSESQIAESTKNPVPEAPQVFVTSTKNAILNGAKFATSGGLSAIVEQIEISLPTSTKVNIIAAGGAAQNAMALSTLSTRKNYYYEPDLVLKGLVYYYDDFDKIQ